jgi:cytosine/adenosine deaminase-related metal-dependent hydrolase
VTRAAVLRRFHADWILPIVSPPIRDGWVSVVDDRIVGVGPDVDAAAAPADLIEDIDLGRVAIMPGLINAHTHVELSWMWGRVKPRASFVEWVSELIALRAAAAHDGTQELTAMTEAIASLEESGTAAIGDISNTLTSIEPIAHSKLHAVVFRELIGFGAQHPEAIATQARADLDRRPPFPRIRLALAPHAPYSVSPGLFRAIAADSATHGTVTSVHLGESREELQFLQDATGPFRDLLERLKAWNPAWRAPATGPVDYLDTLGLLTPRTLVVHGVQFTDADLATLAKRRVTLVTCPRSNVWVGVGDPPVERFYASGLRVAIGTDSLASASDLNLFNELAALHHLAPSVPAARLLESATTTGADALGFPDLGRIDPGACARLIAIDLPETVRDIETYLVEGIDPGQITWVPV